MIYGKMKNEVILTDGDATYGLGFMLKDIVDRNLAKPDICRKIKNLNTKVVIETTDTNVAITMIFKAGKIYMKNGKVSDFNLYIGADFTTLADLCACKISAFKAILKKKLVTKGSMLKLLKIQKVLLIKD
jgi:putative sterol carrier protein